MGGGRVKYFIINRGGESKILLKMTKKDKNSLAVLINVCVNIFLLKRNWEGNFIADHCGNTGVSS
jgi:hypothetical protein